jgi:hypothetical protein
MTIESRKAAARCLLVAFAAGFVYSGSASARLYARLFDRPAARGPLASIDEQVAPLKVSPAEIRAAVRRAAWPDDADVSLTIDARGADGGLSATQLHYALSYVLFPKRIWLAPSPRATRYGIVIGPSASATHTTIERVSDIMTLVDLK